MAERRMTSTRITRSDAFLMMPATTRLLYYDLNGEADDDGFVSNPRTLIRLTGASDDDFNVLIAKNFLIPFESGVVVIKHWKINNLIRKDRYKPTSYQEELSMLSIKDNDSYTLNATIGIPTDNQVTTQDKTRQVNLSKVNLSKESLQARTCEEIKAYAIEINSKVDPVRFFDYCEARDWEINGQPIKDWRALFRSWEKFEKEKTKNPEWLDNHLTNIMDGVETL